MGYETKEGLGISQDRYKATVHEMEEAVREEERTERAEILLSRLKETGAFLEGHFIGASGRHLPLYINKRNVLIREDLRGEIGGLIVDMCKGENIEVVIGPAEAGNVVARWVAETFKERKEKVRFVLSEKDEEGKQRVPEEAMRLLAGRRTLVVEDVVTSGGSLKDMLSVVRAGGADIVKAISLVNRSPEKVRSETFGVPYEAVLEYPVEDYSEEEVPEWLRKIPINTDYGRGAEYLKQKKGK